MKKMLNSKLVGVRLPIHMVQQIKFVAQERGVTEGSVYEAALRDYLGKTEQDEILLKKSDRIARQLDRLRREHKAMFEVLSTFVRVYLAHTQDIPEHEKPNAELKATRKFARFMELVAKGLAEDKPAVDEVFKEDGSHAP